MAPRIEAPEFRLTKTDVVKKVEDILAPLKLSEEVQKRIREVYDEEMRIGLARNPSRKSCLQMENTYLPELPNGTEEGEYLALDLGGTNFRVILLQLEKGRVVSDEVQHYFVPEPLRVGPGSELFDFLAACIYDFLETRSKLDHKLPLGFTFSFPMTQQDLNVGILVSWTKSFNCPGVVGEDAVKMLNEAIQRRGDLEVEVVAVLNDTTGTLVQGAFLDRKCAIGLIIGTGSNACYIERVDRVEKWEGTHGDIKEVVVDIEWGAFGDNGVLDFMKTEYDQMLDKNSLLVGSFTFEKLFSGKYLGELTRLVLVKLAEEGLMFGGKIPSQLLRPGSFPTRFVSLVEQDAVLKLARPVSSESCFHELGIEHGSDDLKILQQVCFAVTERAAILLAICLSATLMRVDREECTIAVDGSLYKYHPRLHHLLEHYIIKMTPGKKFSLLLAEDGSGKGAGLIAAIANRLRTRKHS
ncbi:hexokinase-2-like isoform X2 [Artemia franciscana]|uniref:Phosphotransferase n=1 Tax=Artemia franciscana TaxID=6661 RepID=A0AA88HS73_ARTSF|nr:hypothetical protein QYM36_010053 [Artemia franciscana]KAK2715278.1 hypothetical protein QYM36_010053 [Artemia franciscana]KAK2715279.1 hypothetical protein QYM36_010053 [Artemia franciscana]